MSPQKNRDALLRYFDLLYGQDLNALMDLFAEEVYWFIVPTETHIRGKDSLRALAENHWQASPDRVKTLVNLFASEEFACLEYTSVGRVTEEADFVTTMIAPTGRQYELPCCFVFHFKADGQVDRVREYFDLQTVQRQLSGK